MIGIDLGTSTTEAAIIKDGKPVMILNLNGQVITPSAVGVNQKGKFVFGEEAKAQFLMEPENTVIEVKRKIGTGEMISMGGKKYTPVEISAMLLKHVKNYVEEFLGEEVNQAVISVPAYFDERKRQETVQAGEMAGFKVERIINEPTAAALSYGIEHMEEESHILVYDLGGGTFDVTLLEMFGGVLEVKASSGDNRLGGKDFDECLIEWLVKQFQARYGINLRKRISAMVKIKEEAERCKKELSTKEEYRILIPFIAEKDGKPLALEENITVRQFEELTKELVERTHHPIDIVLADSGIHPEEIDRILLVGGSTRMPMISKDIEAYLHKSPSSAVNPDYAVAEGTAIQAGILEGTLSEEDSIIMTDVNPYTLGVRALNQYGEDYMSVVIPRNITIPVVRKREYYTSFDGQTKANVEVYQGDSVNVEENHFLGEFILSGIPYGKAGKEQIDVEFSYNLNGMLDVKAKIVSNGQEAGVEINMLNMELPEAEDKKPADVSGWKDSKYAKKFRTVIRRADRMLNDEKVQNMPFYHMDLEETLYDLKLALLEDDLEAAQEIEAEILDMLNDI